MEYMVKIWGSHMISQKDLTCHDELVLTHKPIFHCNAKPFALGPRVGLDPQRHNFALGIPTCWYLKTLKFAWGLSVRN